MGAPDTSRPQENVLTAFGLWVCERETPRPVSLPRSLLCARVNRKNNGGFPAVTAAAPCPPVSPRLHSSSVEHSLLTPSQRLKTVLLLVVLHLNSSPQKYVQLWFYLKSGSIYDPSCLSALLSHCNVCVWLSHSLVTIWAVILAQTYVIWIICIKTWQHVDICRLHTYITIDSASLDTARALQNRGMPTSPSMKKSKYTVRFCDASNELMFISRSVRSTNRN